MINYPSHEEMETKLTALLLGELPAEEAEALRVSISQDAELAKLHRRLEQTLGFVDQAAPNLHPKTVPLRLSAPRRQKLLASFKTVTHPKLTKRSARRFPLLELAAVIALMAVAASLIAAGTLRIQVGPIASVSARYPLPHPLARMNTPQRYRGKSRNRAHRVAAFGTQVQRGFWLRQCSGRLLRPKFRQWKMVEAP